MCLGDTEHSLDGAFAATFSIIIGGSDTSSSYRCSCTNGINSDHMVPSPQTSAGLWVLTPESIANLLLVLFLPSSEDGQCLVTLYLMPSLGPPLATLLCPIPCLGRRTPADCISWLCVSLGCLTSAESGRWEVAARGWKAGGESVWGVCTLRLWPPSAMTAPGRGHPPPQFQLLLGFVLLFR